MNYLAWLRTYDRGVLILVGLFVLLLPLATPRVYATDEVQYYVYLRSLRFDGDLDFANDYREFAQRNPRSGIAEGLLQPNRIRQKTGLYGNIAPVGSAIMWAPFFLLADGLVHLANAAGAKIPADGFSWPYINAVCYASALYGFLGVVLSYRLARQYVSQFAATLATVAIWLATPLVFYMFIQMPFAHATGLFLVALFLTIWHTTRSAAGRSWRAWLALGLVGALMTITREQLGLFLLAPAIEALAMYAGLLRRSGGLIAAANLAVRHSVLVVAFVIGLAPQIAVYQILNGEPRPASEVSGKLNLCSPHMLDTLIDLDPAPDFWCSGETVAGLKPLARGAMVWSPVLALALPGLALLWRRDRLLAVVLGMLFLAQTYINGAFGTTWHLSGAFGFRRLIECTPLFVVGLALLIDRVKERFGPGWVVLPVLLLIGWNAGLVVNATVFNAETNLRRGLSWPELWRWQLEAPIKLASKIGDLLFRRCRFFENGNC